MITTGRSYCVPGHLPLTRRQMPILFLALLTIFFSSNQRACGEPSDLCLPVSMNTDILGGYLDQSGPPGTIDGETDDLALAVAISGGSFRAANFAAGVLIGLEQLNHNLLQEVDYISSVSGGGYAVAIYISTLLDHIEKLEKGEITDSEYRLADYFQKSIPENVSYSRSHYPRILLRSGFKGETVTGNLKSLVCKMGMRRNEIASVDYLEKIYDNDMLGYKHRKKTDENAASLTLKDIFHHKTLVDDPDNKYSRLPFWVMNATVVETGELIPFTPSVLKKYNVTGCTHREQPYPVNEARDNIPVSVGLAGSAAFPFIISTLALECDYEGYKKIHLIDGGLSDNLGGYSAITLLMQDKRPHKVLLLVDAFNSFDIPFRQVVHAANKRKIIEICQAQGIHIVCLDFDVLEGEEIYKKLLAARTFYFDVSKSQQNVLLDAGKMIVDYKLGDIKASLPVKMAEKLEAEETSHPETACYDKKNNNDTAVSGNIGMGRRFLNN